MAMVFVGPGSDAGLLGDQFRFRVQKQDESGRWVFFDNYVYDKQGAVDMWRKAGPEGYRVVKISWAKLDAVHSVIKF